MLEAYSEELQKKFLLFTTGSDRVPVGGTSDMTIKITRMHKDKTDRLPVAHTCFNQVSRYLETLKSREPRGLVNFPPKCTQPRI